MSAQALAALLHRVLPGVERRTLVLAAPTPRPPPPGAWAPGGLGVQLPLSGRIELAVPAGDGLREWTIDRRHLLVVCPGSWSPRTQRTARRHLALDIGPALRVCCYRTPVGGGQRAPELGVHLPAPGPALAAARDAAAICARHAPQAAVLRPLILGLLPLLAAELVRADASGGDLAAAIRTELQARCAEDLQRDAVAAGFGISGDHLARLLRSAGGEGFIALLHRYRIERARELLRTTELELAAIAARCGFGSATWFIRCFRRAHGTTPAAWRRAWRGAAGPAA